MLLPALLPESLTYSKIAKSDAQLFELLAKQPVDLVTFFEYACGDETWCQKHGAFVQDALYWLTDQILEDKLSITRVKRIANAIQEHYVIVSRYVELNIRCLINEKEYPASGILLVAASPMLREKLLAECRGTGSKQLTLEGIPEHLVVLFIEAINLGALPHLWREEEQTVLDLLEEARHWEIAHLRDQCEEVLLRYLSRSSVADRLKLALDEGYQILRRGCLSFLNQLSPDSNFPDKGWDRIEMELLEINDDTKDICERLAQLITHLAFRGGLTGQGGFNEMVGLCPNLLGVDISGTFSFSDRLTLLPHHLEELDMAQCAWLNDERLKIMITTCPSLQKISLARNTQLTPASWTHLHTLPQLEGLDISQCDQLRDDTLRFLIHACPHLSELRLDECEHLTDRGFYEIAYHLPELRILTVSRCHLSDAPLIEIATRCHKLTLLDVRRCEGLSLKFEETLIRIHPNIQLIRDEAYV